MLAMPTGKGRTNTIRENVFRVQYDVTRLKSLYVHFSKTLESKSWITIYTQLRKTKEQDPCTGLFVVPHNKFKAF